MLEYSKMTYYRLHANLTNGANILKSGSVNQLSKLTDFAINKLLNNEIISIVSFPPLLEFVGFEDKAELLELVGLTDTEIFLDICSCDIGLMLNMPDVIIDSWKYEILEQLTIKNDGCKCGQRG
jgi:hypothetical protein